MVFSFALAFVVGGLLTRELLLLSAKRVNREAKETGKHENTSAESSSIQDHFQADRGSRIGVAPRRTCLCASKLAVGERRERPANGVHQHHRTRALPRRNRGIRFDFRLRGGR